ncbi:fimbrial protein [Pseudomonas sp. NPDC087639]|uniref:fimbrial protein n=1 Tax=Pseudomonas sp. NPDC087639 TaxID=3364445 RepID=UPI00382833BA
MKKLHCYLLSSFLILLAPFVRANCEFERYSKISETTISLPASLTVPRDLPVGSELWNSGWVKAPSTAVRCSIGGLGFIQGFFASGIGSAVPGFSSGGFSSVYETNVPGIGISIYLCNNLPARCETDFESLVVLGNLLVPIEDDYFPLIGGWLVRLIKTGPVSGSFPLQVPGVNSSWVHALETGVLTLTGQTKINTLGCEILPQSRNLTVSMPSVILADFRDDTTVLDERSKSKAFEIALTCDAGTRLSYQVDGVAASLQNHVLANSSGNGMAIGVGVKLFRGEDGGEPLPLGVRLFHASVDSSSRVIIPIVARYYKTVARMSEMQAGKLSVAATFTLSYE